MINSLLSMPAVAMKLLRDGAGNETNEAFPEAISYFLLKSLLVGWFQILEGLAAAVGYQLGETTELFVAQAGSSVFGSGDSRESFAGHALVLASCEARACREPHHAIRLLGVRASSEL
jgi:hypothetical protein